jgi:hypothetical protein
MKETTATDCYGCSNESIDECPETTKECGHHGNEYWVFGFCDACGKEMVEDDYLETNRSKS